MGLSRSEQELELVAIGLIEELELRNNRPIHPDMLALFVDGKYIELLEGDKLRSACIYIVVGLGCDGKNKSWRVSQDQVVKISKIGSWSCAD